MRLLPGRLDAVLVQAVIAAALSFAHLHDLAYAAGQHGWKAWAYPVSVDLLLVAAWRRLRSGVAKAAGWCWFLVALAASLGANVSTAGLFDLDAVPAWLRILVAAGRPSRSSAELCSLIPPHLAARMRKRRRQRRGSSRGRPGERLRTRTRSTGPRRCL